MQLLGRFLFLLVLLVLPMAVAPAMAQDEDAETTQRDVLVLMRALAYDRNLSERFGTEVKVGVLHEGNRPSDEAALVVGILQALKDVKIGGLAVQVESIRWKDAASLGSSIKDKELDVVYLPAGLDEASLVVPGLCRATSRTSMTRHRPYADAGVALAVEESEGKPQIVVNLEAAKAEGASFQADLLRLADVIR